MLRKELGFVALSIFIVSILVAASAYSQDAQAPAQDQTVKEQVEATMKSEELSIYGEVQSVDTQGAGSLTVQYYDYDTDEEKTITIAADANTAMENVKAMSDIKKGDWADISYTVADGKSVAISIVVEKEEETAPETTAAAPEQPAAEAPVQGI
jgi:regulatory protein YycI of two-component signal transduction system YycFG